MAPIMPPYTRDVTALFLRAREEAHAHPPRAATATAATAPAPGEAGSAHGSEYEGLWLSIQLQADAVGETLDKLQERLREAAKPRLRGEDVHQMGVDRLAEKVRQQLQGYKAAVATLQGGLALARRPEDRAFLQSMLQRATVQMGDMLQRFQRMLADHARAKRHQARLAADVRQKLNGGTRTGTGTGSGEEEERQLEQLELRHMERGLPPLMAQQLALQELIVHEQGREIREVLARLEEVAEMFRDVQALVQQQGEQLDRIDANLVAVREDVRRAHGELQKARQHQKDSCVVM